MLELLLKNVFQYCTLSHFRAWKGKLFPKSWYQFYLIKIIIAATMRFLLQNSIMMAWITPGLLNAATVMSLFL